MTHLVRSNTPTHFCPPIPLPSPSTPFHQPLFSSSFPSFPAPLHRPLPCPSSCPQISPMVMTVGTLDPPLGNTRLQVVRLFSALLQCNETRISREIARLKTFCVLMVCVCVTKYLHAVYIHSLTVSHNQMFFFM